MSVPSNTYEPVVEPGGESLQNKIFDKDSDPASISTLKLKKEEKSSDSITEDELFDQQILMPGEKQPENLKKSFGDLSNSSENQVEPEDYVTGLPSKTVQSEVATHPVTTSQVTLTNENKVEMGNENTKQVERKHPKYIISEDPQFVNNTRRRVEEAETTGNCVPWSDNVYCKLFLDIDGRNARLMVLKCEISYVDVFTDEEHSLYKSRFIGGKADGVTELFAFDLMKSSWEKKIPQSQAIELNVDIVMSSSPIYQCSETLLNLLKLEKSYLKHQRFDGQLNVMIRFAHAYAWDVKDDSIRERVHNGIRQLFREGVNLEVMSSDNIIEEMKVDGITLTNDDRLKHYVEKRHSWKGCAVKPVSQASSSDKGVVIKQSVIDYNYGVTGRDMKPTSSGSPENLGTITDSYYVSLHSALWDIIQDTKRIRGALEETLEDS